MSLSPARKLAPVIFVESVEEQLPFWTERLGFELTATVPGENGIGFAILSSGPVEVMYQSRASVAADIPALAAGPFVSRTNLFLEVPSLDAVLPRLEGIEVIVPRRRTFYGADEIGVRAPCGTFVLVAEFPKEPA